MDAPLNILHLSILPLEIAKHVETNKIAKHVETNKKHLLLLLNLHYI